MTAEINQTLTNIVLADNQIRSNRSKSAPCPTHRSLCLNASDGGQRGAGRRREARAHIRLLPTRDRSLCDLGRHRVGESLPRLYLIFTSSSSPKMRSLVLLRRLLFRSSTSQRVALYDHLGARAIETLQRILLHSLLHEPAVVVRRKTVDTVTDLSNQAMKRG